MDNESQLDRTLIVYLKPCVEASTKINKRPVVVVSTSVPVLLYKLQYIVQVTIYYRLRIGRDGHPKPTIYHNLYENTGLRW